MKFGASSGSIKLGEVAGRLTEVICHAISTKQKVTYVPLAFRPAALLKRPKIPLVLERVPFMQIVSFSIFYRYVKSVEKELYLNRQFIL